jgi:hypothetical protein
VCADEDCAHADLVPVATRRARDSSEGTSYVMHYSWLNAAELLRMWVAACGERSEQVERVLGLRVPDNRVILPPHTSMSAATRCKAGLSSDVR